MTDDEMPECVRSGRVAADAKLIDGRVVVVVDEVTRATWDELHQACEWAVRVARAAAGGAGLDVGEWEITTNDGA